MPHFRFRALDEQVVQTLSDSLLEPLLPLMKSPAEDFTFESISSQFYHSGLTSAAYPFVEVLWFERGQQVQDEVAEVITQQIRQHLGHEQDVAVIFTALNPSQYYDNGQHYGE